MKKIANGHHVSVHYTGTLPNGEVFDSSEGRDPLKFTVGLGKIIEGFDTAVLGLESGQECEVTIPPEKAYGDRDEKMIITVGRDEFGDDLEPEMGMQIGIRMRNGETAVGTVIKLATKDVTLDLNHPLAGQTLNFKIRVVEAHEPGAPGTEDWDGEEEHSCCGGHDHDECGEHNHGGCGEGGCGGCGGH